MAKVTVQIYTTVGEKLLKTHLSIQATTVEETIKIVEEKLSSRFKKEFRNEDGKIKDSYIIALNGLPIDKKKLSSYSLSSGDILQIYPAISGG
jgi:molybdopterin synthase sulfur carrier subunit